MAKAIKQTVTPMWLEIKEFYEQNTKHGISVIQGNYLLGVEEYAILANDDSSFMTDYPNYNKTLLDSSFSLLNSGEYLALYDHETLLDTY